MLGSQAHETIRCSSTQPSAGQKPTRPPGASVIHCLRVPLPSPPLQSFSSVGAIEAAWYRATGKQLLFSEQHMIDCGWEAGNSGCYGERLAGCAGAVLVLVLVLV